MPAFDTHVIDGVFPPEQPTPLTQDRVTQRTDHRLKRLERTNKTAIDRIVSELAEVESWELLAQRAGRRLSPAIPPGTVPDAALSAVAARWAIR
jgi:hypothetical protein